MVGCKSTLVGRQRSARSSHRKDHGRGNQRRDERSASCSFGKKIAKSLISFFENMCDHVRICDILRDVDSR